MATSHAGMECTPVYYNNRVRRHQRGERAESTPERSAGGCREIVYGHILELRNAGSRIKNAELAVSAVDDVRHVHPAVAPSEEGSLIHFAVKYMR